eukprot:1157548-Pelagomonas_calceolata.AAC.7
MAAATLALNHIPVTVVADSCSRLPIFGPLWCYDNLACLACDLHDQALAQATPCASSMAVWLAVILCCDYLGIPEHTEVDHAH